MITNLVRRRGDAEYHGFEFVGSVELPLRDAAEYALVEVDADSDHQPNVPGV